MYIRCSVILRPADQVTLISPLLPLRAMCTYHRSENFPYGPWETISCTSIYRRNEMNYLIWEERRGERDDVRISGKFQLLRVMKIFLCERPRKVKFSLKISAAVSFLMPKHCSYRVKIDFSRLQKRSKLKNCKKGFT